MKIVIFDLDGTLYETNSSVIEAVRQTLAYFSLPSVSEEMIRCGIGKKLEDFLQMLLPEQKDLEAVKIVFRDREYTAVKEHGKLYPGVHKLLKELKDRGYSLYICSNGSEEYIRLVLECTGISKYFTGITSSKFVPSKGIAFQSMVSEGDFAIIIGDTSIDYLGAKEAGLPSIAATYGYGSKQDHGMALFQVSTPMEILDKILLADIFYEVTKDLIVHKKCRCLGISGVDTSGKSRFTEQYSSYLKAIRIENQVLHIDDFHNPSEIRYQGDNEVEAYYQYAFNYQQILEEVLVPLQSEGVLDREVICLNLDNDRYECKRSFRISNSTVLLVEGVLLFREPILPYLDGKVFLHIPFDEVINRAKQRDVPRYGEGFLEKYHKKYIPVQKRYLEEHSPMENSNIVIDNSNYYRPIIINRNLYI